MQRGDKPRPNRPENKLQWIKVGREGGRGRERERESERASEAERASEGRREGEREREGNHFQIAMPMVESC